MYEAQIAGQGDAHAASGDGRDAVDAAPLRARSCSQRRGEIVAAVARRRADLEFVNGGGTGRSSTRHPTRRSPRSPPAAGCSAGTCSTATARSTPRRPPRSRSRSCAGPAADTRRCSAAAGSPPGRPAPTALAAARSWPTGPHDGGPRDGAARCRRRCTGAAARDLRVGDRVWLRHTKCGELSRARRRAPRSSTDGAVVGDGRRPIAAKGRRSCDGDRRHVAELGPLRARASAARRAPARRPRPCSAPSSRRRRPGMRVKAGRRRPQLHRHRRRTRRAARPRRPQRARRASTRARPGHARRRHPAAPGPGAARAVRPRHGEHRRHRPAVDRGRDLDRHARHRRARSAGSPPRSSRCTLVHGDPASCCAIGETENAELLPAVAARARRARRSSSTSPCSASRRSCCTPSSTRSRCEEVLDELRASASRQRPLRVLLVPAHRHGADEDEHPAAADGARAHPLSRGRHAGSTTSCSPTASTAVVVRASARSCPAIDPAVQPARPVRLTGNREFTDASTARLRHQPRPVRFREMEYALPARGRAGGASTRCGRSSTSAAGASRSPWRCASPPPTTTGCRPRTGARSGYIAVHRYYREDPTRVLRGRRGDHAVVRRAPALGQDAHAGCRHPARALPAVRRLRRAARPARPASGCSQNAYLDRVLGE